MSFQTLNPELSAKVLFLANLQRSLMQNQNVVIEKTADGNHLTSTMIGQQQSIHPLLIPSFNVSSQKISAMLTALTPSAPTNTPVNRLIPPSLAISNNNAAYPRMINSSSNIRSNGSSSFGWGNRERKMEENWRMQNRNL